MGRGLLAAAEDHLEVILNEKRKMKERAAPGREKWSGDQQNIHMLARPLAGCAGRWLGDGDLLGSTAPGGRRGDGCGYAGDRQPGGRALLQS